MNFNVMICLAVINAVQNFGLGSTNLADNPQLTTVHQHVKTRCEILPVNKLYSYDCSSMELEVVPQNIRSSVEILELSYNRIRDLTRDSFARYTSLKYLYLFHNMIYEIEEGTFSILTELEAIDLGDNILKKIPFELFELPLLRIIRYQKNKLDNLDEDLKALKKPVKAPIQNINLSNCKLRQIPDFGILPDLLILNVSSNDLSNINPLQLSPFCSITLIDINATNIKSCNCQLMKIYLHRRNINTTTSIFCETVDEGSSYCPDQKNSTHESSQYFECKKVAENKVKSAETRKTWFSILSFVFAIFVIFMVFLYCLHRKNVKQMDLELNQIKLKQIHQTENGNKEVLLNRT